MPHMFRAVNGMNSVQEAVPEEKDYSQKLPALGILSFFFSEFPVLNIWAQLPFVRRIMAGKVPKMQR